MLIEFTVENYKSFKDKTTLSMVASSDKTSLPQNVIEPTGNFKHRLLKSAVIYGANASGKSNFIKAMEFMKNFVWDSIKGDDRSIIDVEPFLFDSESANKPTMFEVDFISNDNNVRYIYGFTADRKKIHEEWLYSFPKGKQVLLFERFLDEAGEQQYKFNRSLSSTKDLVKKTRHNSLFLTVATAFNVEAVGWASKWINSELFHLIHAGGYTTSSMLNYGGTTERLQVIELLQKADLGISDIEVYKKSDDDFDYDFDIVFIRKIRNQLGKETSIRLSFENESDGTQKFYRLAGDILILLEGSFTVFSDELDLRLHPMLVEWILGLFNNSQLSNPGVQLIFTTHNTEIMNPKLFRRDQIWFSEKDHTSGASELFPLTDYKARKGENYKKNYLEGRYGAIPILEKFDFPIRSEGKS